MRITKATKIIKINIDRGLSNLIILLQKEEEQLERKLAANQKTRRTLNRMRQLLQVLPAPYETDIQQLLKQLVTS